ncbi:MAG TPA: hypothetical protein VFF87_10680 [Hyphomicrobium sp.]|nr:hypothetical protein [Hyphomicrobium sp.]
MWKLKPLMAASLGVMMGLAALAPAAEARGFGGGGGFGGHGGFGGGERGGGWGDRGGGERGGGWGDRGGGEHGRWGPDGGGYGPVPGHTNPYARDAVPWIGMNYNDLLQTPPNNSGSSMPNDCNYLYQRAIESPSPQMWQLFNDCAHNR